MPFIHKWLRCPLQTPARNYGWLSAASGGYLFVFIAEWHEHQQIPEEGKFSQTQNHETQQNLKWQQLSELFKMLKIMLFIYLDYVSFNISWFLKVWLLTMNIFVIHIFKHKHALGLSECKMCVFV